MRMTAQRRSKQPRWESGTIERSIPVDEVELGVRPYDAYSRDVNFIASHKAQLDKKFRDEWIAVLDEVVVAHSANHEALLAELRGRGALEREPVIVHCPTVPPHSVF